MMSSIKARGMLFGAALGDALGWPVEFMKLTQIKAHYGPLGIQSPPNPAIYTDDTQMTLALARGLISAGLDADLDVQMQHIGQQFLVWKHSPENNRAPGSTVMAGLARYEQGVPWRVSGLINSKGCGSAMRVAAIGFLYQHDKTRLRAVAQASSLITHQHPAAIAASIAGAYLVSLALDGTPPSAYMRLVMDFTEGISDEFDGAILRIGHVLGWTNEEAALDHIGQGWTGDEAIALALYCVLRYPDDYAACVRRAANTNGDSDSIACIAGGISGARLGMQAIPADWVSRCENRDILEGLCEQMVVLKGA